MTATTIKITEGTPDKRLAFRQAVQERVEAYIKPRWGVRSVVYLVEGPGEWVPPLVPTTITTVEQWANEAWSAVTLSPTPLGGYCLTADGMYRFTGTAGHNIDPNAGAVTHPPEAVIEALTRLDGYFRAMDRESPVTGTFGSIKRETPPEGAMALSPAPAQPQSPLSLVDGLGELSDRPANWKARALQLSGAADLLRPWRMLG